jgi:hypothetical protein
MVWVIMVWWYNGLTAGLMVWWYNGLTAGIMVWWYNGLGYNGVVV